MGLILLLRKRGKSDRHKKTAEKNRDKALPSSPMPKAKVLRTVANTAAHTFLLKMDQAKQKLTYHRLQFDEDEIPGRK